MVHRACARIVEGTRGSADRTKTVRQTYWRENVAHWVRHLLAAESNPKAAKLYTELHSRKCVRVPESTAVKEGHQLFAGKAHHIVSTNGHRTRPVMLQPRSIHLWGY